MQRIDASQFAVGDVVVTDCLVIKNPHSQGWDVLFEMVGMALLARVAREQ